MSDALLVLLGSAGRVQAEFSARRSGLRVFLRLHELFLDVGLDRGGRVVIRLLGTLPYVVQSLTWQELAAKVRLHLDLLGLHGRLDVHFVSLLRKELLGLWQATSLLRDANRAKQARQRLHTGTAPVLVLVPNAELLGVVLEGEIILTDRRWNHTHLTPFFNCLIQLLVLLVTQPRAIGVAEQKETFRPEEEEVVSHGLEVLREVLGLLSCQVSRSRVLQPTPLLRSRPSLLHSRPVAAVVVLLTRQGEIVGNVRHRGTHRARGGGGGVSDRGTVRLRRAAILGAQAALLCGNRHA